MADGASGWQTGGQAETHGTWNARLGDQCVRAVRRPATGPLDHEQATIQSLPPPHTHPPSFVKPIDFDVLACSDTDTMDDNRERETWAAVAMPAVAACLFLC